MKLRSPSEIAEEAWNLRPAYELAFDDMLRAVTTAQREALERAAQACTHHHASLPWNSEERRRCYAAATAIRSLLPKALP